MKNKIFLSSIFFILIHTSISFGFEPILIDQEPSKYHSLENDSIPKLHRAVLNGDAKKVKCLLKKKTDVMSLDANGETALMYACKNKLTDFEILSLLLEHGSDILYKSPKTRNSAFYSCIDSSKVEVVQFLLDRLSPNEKEILRTTRTYLAHSIMATEPEMVKLFIPYTDDLNTVYGRQTSLLEYAVDQAVSIQNLKSSRYDWEGKEKLDVEPTFEVIRILLSNGVLLNKDPTFSYVAYDAIESPVVFRFLIENGLVLDRPLKLDGLTLSLLDCFLNRVANKEILITQDKEVDLTQPEKLKIYLDVLDLMINKGVESNDSELTPYQRLLVKAVSNNSVQLTQMIFERKNVEPNFVDLEGKTLMIRAEEIGNAELIDWLIKNGAK